MFKPQNPAKPHPQLTGTALRSKAFALLSKRDYSKQQLSDKLKALCLNLDELNQLIEEFEQHGYLNDQRFAEALARQQIRQGKGPVRLQQKLKQAGLDQQRLDHELQQVNWLAQAIELRRRKFGNDLPADNNAKTKQIRFLQYRGFTMNVILKAIATNESDETD